MLIKGEDILRSNNEVLKGSSTTADPSKSTLKERRSGGAERGRGGKAGLWTLGRDFQVFRGGESKVRSFTCVSIGDEGAEVEPPSAISSVTIIERLTGGS